jgi:hypothetical protein
MSLQGALTAPNLQTQLLVGSWAFWVEDESPPHGNFSPRPFAEQR